MTAIELIVAERKRQIEREGWTPKHDDQHVNCELALAAAAYAAHDERLLRRNKRVVIEEKFAACTHYSDPWPSSWDTKWDKRGKHDRIRQLVIAGALIAAEIDRLQRAAQPGESAKEGQP